MTGYYFTVGPSECQVYTSHATLGGEVNMGSVLSAIARNLQKGNMKNEDILSPPPTALQTQNNLTPGLFIMIIL